MFAIVETQGFHLGAQFIPKEITFIKNSQSPVHFLIKTEAPLQFLTSRELEIVKWNSTCYHGIPWEMGEITLNECVAAIKKLCTNDCKLFTKGREKSKFFSKLLDENVDDMGTTCPSIRKIPYINQCNAHKIVNARCSLVSALYLHNWVQNGHCNLVAIPEEDKQKA
jgi:hypothetical protein